MTLKFRPRRILTVLVSIILLLTLANAAALILKIVFDHDYVHGFVPMFDFNSEANIPTYYSTFAILAASVLLALIGVAHKRKDAAHRAWLEMSAIFLFLSIDEFASLHEMLMAPGREIFNATGLFYHVWIIPYGIVVLLFVVRYAKFLLELPVRIMYLFIVSGALFVLGAIGVEAVSGMYLEQSGPDGYYYLMTSCEELLEMSGIALLIYTLSSYISVEIPEFRVSINL